jgi:hypothetical protein
VDAASPLMPVHAALPTLPLPASTNAAVVCPPSPASTVGKRICLRWGRPFHQRWFVGRVTSLTPPRNFTVRIDQDGRDYPNCGLWPALFMRTNIEGGWAVVSDDAKDDASDGTGDDDDEETEERDASPDDTAADSSDDGTGATGFAPRSRRGRAIKQRRRS